jgi:dihydrofolate synthase/folylpolyglutamate synthase
VNSFTPEQAERWLMSLEMFGMRFGLERMRRLMTALGSPQESFRSAQVLGTNGKSSTARMTAALLQAHGVRSGAYLSPHLRAFAERVEVDGHQVSDGDFAAAVGRAARAAALVDRTLEEGDRVTQFEALTAAAYSELARAGVEAAVIEAGLGGRYDATSVIAARVHVLTNVGLEHTRWLGPTERHIAEEKLAVVRSGSVLVTGKLGDEAADVARRVAADHQVPVVRLGEELQLRESGDTLTIETPRGRFGDIRLAPLGTFQHENFALAVAAAEALISDIGLGSLDAERVRHAAAGLVLPGRMEVISQEPLVMLDGAHNPSGARALGASLLDATGGRRPIAVASIMDDKDAAGILAALVPVTSGAIFTRAARQGALPPATLASLWSQLEGGSAQVVPEPAEALARAIREAGPDGAVLVTGSLYLLSQLIREGGAQRRSNRRA